MNDAARKAVHSSDRMDWATPPEVFDPLYDEFLFDLDAAADSTNYKVPKYFTKEDDAIFKEWHGSVFCNPPYGRGIGLWVRKAHDESRKRATVVMLLPSRTGTRWWHSYVWDHANHCTRPGVEVRFVKGRIRFVGAPASAPFDSCIIIFRPPPR